MSNNWDINILVNGNRCKQYQHQGKTFIQANQGSEYVLEIKNNYWKRILAVSAVDGLNVLTGKTASEQDTGYIIDSYHSEKIKGFRFSDDEWAMFKFGYKFNGKTYAQSKNDGSEQNCGVIGFRLFYEQEPVVTYNNPVITWTHPITPWYPFPTPVTPWYPSPIWTTCAVSASWSGTPSVHNDIQYNTCTSNVNLMGCQNLSSDNVVRSAGNSVKYSSNLKGSNSTKGRVSQKISAMNICASPAPKGFDVGTEWGRKEQSKVTTINFEKGYLAHSLDIYYASRESLIEMGVPLNNNIKVNLPQSFPEKYATPPKNWVG